MREGSDPKWQVIEEFEKTLRGIETDIIARKREVASLESDQAERDRRLDLREKELDLREKGLEERDEGLKKRQQELDDYKTELGRQAQELDGIRDAVGDFHARLAKRESDLDSQERELLVLLERTETHENRIKDILERMTGIDQTLEQEEAAARRALDAIHTVREKISSREITLLEQANAISAAKKVVVEEHRRFMDWGARLNDKSRQLEGLELELKRIRKG